MGVMRKYLFGALLLLFAACNKPEDETGSAAGIIQFGAGSLETKAAWGNDVDGAQQIIWENGDAVRIASDYAYDHATTSQNWSDYTVTRINEVTRYSRGSLNPTSSGAGLMWNSEAAKANHGFWGVYPSREISESYRILGDIPSDNLLMVAHATGPDQGEDNKVSLLFYPAFTTVRALITNTTGYPVTINSISLSSAQALQGVFSGQIADEGVTDVQLIQPYGAVEIPVATETTVWSDPNGTTNGVIAGVGALADAQVGQKVKVYFKQTGDHWYQFGLQCQTDPWSWSNFYFPEVNNLNAVTNDDYMAVEPGVENCFEFALTQDMISMLNSVYTSWDGVQTQYGSLRVTTGNCVITKVTRETAGSGGSGLYSYIAENTGIGYLADEQTMSSFSDFTLIPWDFTDLRLTVNYTVEGQGAVYKSLTIPSAILAGKQYRLTGIILPDNFELINFTVVSQGYGSVHNGHDTWRF